MLYSLLTCLREVTTETCIDSSAIFSVTNPRVNTAASPTVASNYQRVVNIE
jgi:hypothetical protein